MREISRPGERIGGAPERKPKWRGLLAFVLILTVSIATLTYLEGRYYVWIFGGEMDAANMTPTKVATEQKLPPRIEKGVEVSAEDALVFKLLGISTVPPAILRDHSIAGWIDQLRRENCNWSAISPLSNALKRFGYVRESADVLRDFAFRCRSGNRIVDDAIEIYMGISDFSEAHRLSNILIADDPASARFRYLRARAAEKLDMLEQSLTDHIDALNLLGDPKRVAGSVFYDVSRAYARLGQYCEAITPIQQWIAYDNSRETAQTRTLLRDYSVKGQCASAYAKVDAVYTAPASGNVIKATVLINGVPGVFIVDTGATFVSFTEDFAQRAKVPFNKSRRIQLATANGITDAWLATADSVSIGRIQAHRVAAAISEQKHFGPGVVGLLGMSFLARFDVSIQPNKIEIKKPR